MIAHRFIAGAWGTTRLDAHLLDESGRSADRLSLVIDLQTLSREDIVGVLDQLRKRWPTAAPDIWLAGMIGSGLGWREIAHLPCPADADAIAAACAPMMMGPHQTFVSPGLRVEAEGSADVLRGEEVAALGWAGAGCEGLLLTVPGRHGKWLRIAGGEVQSFHSAMTVELGELIAAHSILREQMTAPPRPSAAFTAGVEVGRRFGIARSLFSARTRAGDASSYVWGVLIGHDVDDGLRATAPDLVACTGAEPYATLFEEAVRLCGARVERIDYAACLGLGFAQMRRAARSAQ